MRIPELIFGIVMLGLMVATFIFDWPLVVASTTFLIGAAFTFIGYKGEKDD